MAVFVCVFIILLAWNLSDVKKGKNGPAKKSSGDTDYFGADAFSDPDTFADARRDEFPDRAAAMDYWTKHSKYSPFHGNE